VEETTATAELAPAPGPLPHEAEHDVHTHPSPAKYVGIGIILAAITALEVGVYYLNLPGRLMVAVLVGLAFIKFSMVAAYFMHLKFDGRLLRRLFLTGIALAATVYFVALITLGVLFG
jgi:cytochrome c oxidase subunit IV